MAGTITSLGIGSGLNLNSLVDQLVLAEGQGKVTQLNKEEASTQSEISGFGLLNSSLSGFQSALSGLQTLTDFQSRTSTSGDTTVYTVDANDTAPSGTFGIEVTQLAVEEKLNSTGFTDADTDVGSGIITIGIGANNFSVTIDSAAMTLTDIKDAINDASDNVGITAAVITIDDGGGGAESQLVFTSDSVGTDNKLTITVDDDDLNDTDNLGLSQLVYDPDGTGTTNLSELQAAKDAIIKIDGLTVTNKASNVFSDAINGVTITAIKEDPGITNDLVINIDKVAAKQKVTDFVNSYNTMMVTINDLNKFDPDTGIAGLLFGDPTLRTIDSQIRTLLYSDVSSVTGSLDRLADIGITTDINGLLEIDDADLDAVMDSSFNNVGEIFASSSGLAVVLDDALDEFTQFGGLLDTKDETLDKVLARIDTDRVDLEENLQALEDRLLKKFGALDALLAQFENTKGFLTQQLDALPGFKFNNE